MVVASRISLGILGWLQMTCVAKTFPWRHWMVHDYLARKMPQWLFFLNITQTDESQVYYLLIYVVFMFNIPKLQNKQQLRRKNCTQPMKKSTQQSVCFDSGSAKHFLPKTNRIIRMKLACLKKTERTLLKSVIHMKNFMDILRCHLTLALVNNQ